MISRNYSFRSENKLNVEKLRILVEYAKQFKANILIEHYGTTANMKSLPEVVLLCLPKEAVVSIKTFGVDAYTALDEIGKFLTDNKLNANKRTTQK